MPKKDNPIHIRLNLLSPQSNPEKIYIKATRWILSTGRYILIIVELVVFAAFLSRFKFDADLAANTEQIESKIPFIESYKPEETLVRQIQQQISLVKTVKTEYPDYTAILNAIASQTPQKVSITTIDISKKDGKVSLKISGRALNNNELSSFIKDLQVDPNFSEVALTSAGLEERVIVFSIEGNALITRSQQKVL